MKHHAAICFSVGAHVLHGRGSPSSILSSKVVSPAMAPPIPEGNHLLPHLRRELGAPLNQRPHLSPCCTTRGRVHHICTTTRGRHAQTVVFSTFSGLCSESCWAHSLSPQTCERIRRPAKNTCFFAGLVFWVSPQFCQFCTPAGLSVGLFLCRLVQQLPQLQNRLPPAESVHPAAANRAVWGLTGLAAGFCG